MLLALLQVDGVDVRISGLVAVLLEPIRGDAIDEELVAVFPDDGVEDTRGEAEGPPPITQGPDGLGYLGW